MGSICDLYGIYIYIWDLYGIYMGSIWDIYGIYIYGIYMAYNVGKTHKPPMTGNCNHTTIGGSMIICVETVVETKHVWNWVGIIRL